MKKHQIVSDYMRQKLFNPPSALPDIIKHYTFSEPDMELIRQKRRPENKLGFAVQLAYMRMPGRVIEVNEVPSQAMLEYVARQVDAPVACFADYGRRQETRREHMLELYAHLNVCPFSPTDRRALLRSAMHAASATDNGETIIEAMLEWMRGNHILFPSFFVVERLALAARALARRQAYRTLAADLPEDVILQLEHLLVVNRPGNQSTMSWLRNWNEMPKLKNLKGVLERLKTVRELGVEAEREQLVHRARYQLIADEATVVDVHYLLRSSYSHRLAVLVVFAREMEATLIDATVAMIDKLVGTVFTIARNQHKTHLASKTKEMKQSSKTLLKLARTVLLAKEADVDIDDAIAKVIGWSQVKEIVAAAETTIASTRDDEMHEVLTLHVRICKLLPLLLDHICLRTEQVDKNPLFIAIGQLQAMLKQGKPLHHLPETANLSFMSSKWLTMLKQAEGKTRLHVWEIAMMVELRDQLNSGSVWIEGSRNYRPFESYLLPLTVYQKKEADDELGLGIPTRYIDWLTERTETLETRMRHVAKLAEAGELPQAELNAEGLTITPYKATTPPEAETLSRRLHRMLPPVNITDLLAEVNEWTEFAECFTHTRTGEPTSDLRYLMSVILADATNLGLQRMARSMKLISHSQLVWTSSWYVREEGYDAALRILVEHINAEPFAQYLGDGHSSSSDGQFHRSGARGKAQADHDRHYGSEPGLKHHTALSNHGAPFYHTLSSPKWREWLLVLDAILHHGTSLDIREHHTDTASAVEMIFALFHMLGIRFAPRMKDFHERKIYCLPDNHYYPILSSIRGGIIKPERTIEPCWDEALHFVSSMRAGTAKPSVLLRKLQRHPQKTQLRQALRDIGRIERSCFMLEWISNLELRQRTTRNLNMGENRNNLAKTVFFHRHGEFRDRTWENMQHRASGLNLVTAAISLWNHVYLNRALETIKKQDEIVPDEHLTHIFPFGWEHINLNGDYIWAELPQKGAFRGLRNPENVWEMAA